MVNIVEFMKTLSKFGITANQFLLLYLTMIHRFDLLYEYIQNIRKSNTILANDYGGIPDYEINNLLDRGFLIDLGGDRTYADNYIVTDKFSKFFKTIDNNDALDFWNEYPERISNETTSWRGRNMNKDAFLIYYNNLIGHDKVLHDKIIKTLKYEKKKGLLKEGMQKWLERRPWESFNEETNITRNDLI